MEFPEARIYEETLNILLYESHDGRGPDNALLEATGGAAGRSHHLDEDEERERIERVRRIHIKRPDDRTHHHQWPSPLYPCSLSLPVVPYEILFVSIILSPASLQENTAIKWVPYNHV